MQQLEVAPETYTISYIPETEFKRVLDSRAERFDKLRLVSEMCRLNTLSSVKHAGSGHLGTSFSAMEMFVYLYLDELNVAKLGAKHPDRDVFFSSKGHDCPSQYVVMAVAGLIPFEQTKKLRRLGGLDGHPDVKTPGIEAHTGSLGMGISKAKGIAFAKRITGHEGRVVVMTGDGELQEGQIWESLQTAAHQGVTNIIALVDHNKLQSDKWVDDIIALGDLERKLADFGWHVERIDGHDFEALEKVFRKLEKVADKPKIVVCDTVKGKGISFMEGPTAMQEGIYRYHSGAPSDEAYERAYGELLARVQGMSETLGLGPVATEAAETRERNRVALKSSAEKVVTAYGEELLKLGGERKDLVVLDADLADDCGLRPFEHAWPERFIENGIAEQDMASAAGGLALQGLLPVVNSFGAFLCARANEQIYINNIEYTKIVYVSHYAGLIPAGPGQSHQNLRDISLFGAFPNTTILQPCNGAETKMATRWMVNEAPGSCLMRLVISPSPRNIELPEGYQLTPGMGVVLHEGKDAVLFAYGPVMLNEALGAAEGLAAEGFGLRVVNMPWLNRIDGQWLEEAAGGYSALFVMEDHQPVGGLGDRLLDALHAHPRLRALDFHRLAVDGYAACGTPAEVLAFHGLDAASVARRVKSALGR